MGKAVDRIGSDIYFAIVPEWVIDAPISAQAVRLYAVLNRYANKDDSTCFPAIKTIAKRMHTSESTVKRAMTELKDIKAIYVEARYNNATGEQTSNLYTINHVPEFIYEQPPITDDMVGSSSMTHKSKSINQSNNVRNKNAEQYVALCEAFRPPQTPEERSGYNKVAKSLRLAGATHQDIIERVLVYRTEWSNIRCTPYALVKHWSELGELLEASQTKNKVVMCDGVNHLQIIEFDDGFSFCNICKTEYPKDNPYIPKD